MLTPPASHSCIKDNKECVEQIPAREREKQPDSAAALLDKLRRRASEDAKLIKKLSECPRDAGLGAETDTLIASTLAIVDALKAYRTSVPGPAAAAARAAPAAPPVGAPFTGPATAAAATTRKRPRVDVDEDDDDVAAPPRRRAAAPFLPNHQAQLRLPGQHLGQNENGNITGYTQKMADVFPFVVLPEAPQGDGFLWRALKLAARYDNSQLQRTNVATLLATIKEQANWFLGMDFDGGEDARRALDIVQSLQILLVWCCCGRNPKYTDPILNAMLGLGLWLGLFNLSLRVDGDGQQNSDRARALLATYYLHTV